MKVGTDGVLLGAWATTPHPEGEILDVGTGTGVVALMMAQRFPKSRLTAIDIDINSVRQAKENALHSPFTNRICVEHTSLQDIENQTFTAIVSNPPYFYDSLTCHNQERTTARHALTLTMKDIATASADMLEKGGQLSVILPFNERLRMESEACFAGLFLQRVCEVKTTQGKHPTRILLGFTNIPCDIIERESITIGDEMYKQLIKDFYLHNE